jgi:hypothetical protein
LNGTAPPVRAHRADSFNWLSDFQTSAAIFGRQFGQVVTFSASSRFNHNPR